MDPNATLAKIRAFVERWEGSAHAQRPIDEYDDAIEAMIDLDKWITRGGSLPDGWARQTPKPCDHGRLPHQACGPCEGYPQRALSAPRYPADRSISRNPRPIF